MASTAASRSAVPRRAGRLAILAVGAGLLATACGGPSADAGGPGGGGGGAYEAVIPLIKSDFGWFPAAGITKIFETTQPLRDACAGKK